MHDYIYIVYVSLKRIISHADTQFPNWQELQRKVTYNLVMIHVYISRHGYRIRMNRFVAIDVQTEYIYDKTRTQYIKCGYSVMRLRIFES